jgi:hypothetical protein
VPKLQLPAKWRNDEDDEDDDDEVRKAAPDEDAAGKYERMGDTRKCRGIKVERRNDAVRSVTTRTGLRATLIANDHNGRIIGNYSGIYNIVSLARLSRADREQAFGAC